MLVYTLKDRFSVDGADQRCSEDGKDSASPEPPPRVTEVIDQLNAEHNKLCDVYTQK